MRGEVVGDDVNVPAWRLGADRFVQETDEFFGGVAIGGFANHLSAARVKGRIKRQRPMTVILETVPLRATRRERQHRVESVERLDGCLLIDTEDGCMARWPQVEANHRGRLGFKLRIITDHVAAQPVGLQSAARPNATDPRLAHSQRLGQFAAAPLRRTIQRLLMQSPIHNPCLDQFDACRHRPRRKRL